MIRFEEITNKNIWKVCALEPFEEQKDFVAENIQSLANAKLDSNGYLFLYDVYDALGVLNFINTDAVKASHVVGWIKGVGDDEVRFQLVPVPVKSMYSDGEVMNIAEKVLVDFNCCGTILDRI